MSKLIAGLLMGLMNAIVTSAVMDDVIALVKEASSLNLSGDEKKARVKAALIALRAEVGGNIAKLSGNVINLAIEAAVAWVRAKSGAEKVAAVPVVQHEVNG